MKILKTTNAFRVSALNDGRYKLSIFLNGRKATGLIPFVYLTKRQAKALKKVL